MLILLSRHTGGVVCIVDIQQISANNSLRLRMISFRVLLIVLQGFYTFPTTGHPLSSHSNHQKFSMEIPLEILCHKSKPFRSGSGYVTCLAGLDKGFQSQIFPSIHWSQPFSKTLTHVASLHSMPLSTTISRTPLFYNL